MIKVIDKVNEYFTISLKKFFINKYGSDVGLQQLSCMLKCIADKTRGTKTSEERL